MALPLHKLLPLVVPFLIATGITIALIYEKRLLERIAAKLHLKKIRMRLYSGNINGLPYEIRFIAASKNSPSGILLEVACPLVGSGFTIVKENPALQFLKRIPIVQDVETRDPNFDEKFFVTAFNSETAKQCLAQAEIRDVVLSLGGTDLPFQSLTFGAQKVRGRFAPVAWRDAKTDLGALIGRIVPQLHQLRPLIDRVRPPAMSGLSPLRSDSGMSPQVALVLLGLVAAALYWFYFVKH